tara:strand:+ start:617 stop:1774 length:1158 start_codon:yes stop_codon:yes gene_type:complete
LKAKQIILAMVLLPFWHVSAFFPRKRNTVVFGAWFGEKYSDNAMYLFEYACRMRELDCVWLTHKKSIVTHLRARNEKVYYIWSLKGIWYSLISGIVVISSGKGDVNQYFINGAKIINLWHGAPMKKIGKSNNLLVSESKENIRKYCLPNIYEYNIDFIVSTSKEFDSLLMNAFDLLPSQIIKSGYPRNDVFFKNITVQNEDLIKVAYLPTFRDKESNYNLFEPFGFQTCKFDNFLRSNNVELHIGTHFASDFQTMVNDCDHRIKLIPSDEFFNINEYLLNIDVLITDYSGAYFDFLLSNKPIILAPFDLDFYNRNCRELSFEYFGLECFGFAVNWGEVMMLIEKIRLVGVASENVKKKVKLNDYHRGESTKALYDIIKKISNKNT